MPSLSYVVMFVFFFKQKTAYEMRISDWSSDVCSSDLVAAHRLLPQPHHQPRNDAERALAADEELLQVIACIVLDHLVHRGDDPPVGQHRFDSQHLFAHHAIADDAHAAGIRRRVAAKLARAAPAQRSEEHTSELQSLMRISYAVFCLK